MGEGGRKSFGQWIVGTAPPSGGMAVGILCLVLGIAGALTRNLHSDGFYFIGAYVLIVLGALNIGVACWKLLHSK